MSRHVTARQMEHLEEVNQVFQGEEVVVVVQLAEEDMGDMERVISRYRAMQKC